MENNSINPRHKCVFCNGTFGVLPYMVCLCLDELPPSQGFSWLLTLSSDEGFRGAAVKECQDLNVLQSVMWYISALVLGQSHPHSHTPFMSNTGSLHHLNKTTLIVDGRKHKLGFTHATYPVTWSAIKKKICLQLHSFMCEKVLNRKVSVKYTVSWQCE